MKWLAPGGGVSDHRELNKQVFLGTACTYLPGWAMRRAFVLLMSALPLMSCAVSDEAPRNVVLSNAPDAPGYLIVGISEQNYRWDLAIWTQSIALTFTSPSGRPVTVTRSGCGSGNGFFGNKPCDLRRVALQVLQVQPGEWTPTSVAEIYHAASTDTTFHDQVTPALPIKVRPGEIVYAGDYIFAGDADVQNIRLAQHSYSDAEVQTVLALYPGLSARPVAYKGAGTAQ